jgi:hypothetical protein
LLAVFAGGPIVYDVQRADGASLMAHLLHSKLTKKNRLEARKLRPLEVLGERVVVLTGNSRPNIITYFQTPQNIFKYYFVAFRVKR